jgi:soluble lytic murein transglycosylase-like protein
MRIPLWRYYLLTAFSACFFFTVFHTVAEAHSPEIAPSAPSIGEAAYSDESVLFEPTSVPTALPTPTLTPAPTNTPTPTPRIIRIVTSAELETLFAKYGAEFNVDPNWLKKIAKCESNFNQNANNSGLYLGMFQFAAQTWSSTRRSMGLDPNPELRTNAEESIKTAAFMLARGRQNAWPNCH